MSDVSGLNIMSLIVRGLFVRGFIVKGLDIRCLIVYERFGGFTRAWENLAE